MPTYINKEFAQSGLFAFSQSPLKYRNRKPTVGILRQILQNERPWAGQGPFGLGIGLQDDTVLTALLNTGRKLPYDSLSPSWNPSHSNSFDWPSNDFRAAFRKHWRRRTVVMNWSTTVGGVSPTSYTSHDIVTGTGMVCMCDGMPLAIDPSDGGLTFNSPYGSQSSYQGKPTWITGLMPTGGGPESDVTLDYVAWNGYKYTGWYLYADLTNIATTSIEVTFDDDADEIDFPAELTLCTGLTSGVVPTGHGLMSRSFPAFSGPAVAAALTTDLFQNSGYNIEPRDPGGHPGVNFPTPQYSPRVEVTDYDGSETLTPPYLQASSITEPWWGQTGGPYPIGLGAYWIFQTQELCYRRDLDQYVTTFDVNPVLGIRMRFRINTAAKYFLAHAQIVNNGYSYFFDTSGSLALPSGYGTANGGGSYNTLEDVTIEREGRLGPGIMTEIPFPEDSDFIATSETGTLNCGSVNFMILGETPADWSSRTGLSYS